MQVDQKILDEVNTALKSGMQPPDFIKVRSENGTEHPLIIVCKARESEDTRARNVAANIDRPIIRFHQLPLMNCRGVPIALVGGGPSVAGQLDRIRKFDHIMACGSAHDFLQENGITPTWALSTDPAEETIKYFKRLNKKTTYLIASQSNPNMFEALEGYDTVMWNFAGQIDNEKEVFKGEPSWAWGCMVGVNAIQISLLLGYQYLHFFGYDCCLTGKTHAYDVGQAETKEINDARIIAQIGDPGQYQSFFSTTTALIMQAGQIMEIFKSEDGKFLKGFVYGNGMLAAIVRQSPPEMANWLEAVDGGA